MARATALLMWLLVGSLYSTAFAQDAGKYVGSVQTEWLPDGRSMRLPSSFKYIDPKGVEWSAPQGAVVDGASIPQPAWSFIGGPFEGKYRNASVIHDVACDQKKRRWEDVHLTFYWAMLASGVENWRAKIMYGAVYLGGPRWPATVIVADEPGMNNKARQSALSQASPGSSADLVDVRPSAAVPQKVDYVIKVTPPPAQLSAEEFERLKERIRQLESSGSGVTLDQIRSRALLR